MKYIHLLTLLVLVSCSSSKITVNNSDDHQIDLDLVQVNDVYEIAPVEGGSSGGMARIATIKKQVQRSNPNTLLLMAGDFLSPSVYNSLRYQDSRIRGKQMVEAMNIAGFDLACFGNHEFDITEKELGDRLDESAFRWVSSNSFHKKEDSIEAFTQRKTKLPEYDIITLKDKDGTSARVGFIGITITTNTSGYVSYTDPLQSAKLLCARLKDSCDAIVAITHQDMADDIILAREIPSLAVIIGGHEHDMRFVKQGNVYITKAHSNARSAFIVHIHIDKEKKSITVSPVLRQLNDSVPLDAPTDSIVKKWKDIANQNYRSIGFSPEKIVRLSGDSLEAREKYIKTGSTNMTAIIVKAMQFASPQSDMVIMNAGSVRLDDVLYTPISQYDILRSMPFGGSIREVEMKGSLLQQVLEAGKMNKGSGGFLHYGPLPEKIEAEKIYKVALSDYLLAGRENNLRFLNEKNPSITGIYPEVTAITDPRSDIRLAIVQYMDRFNTR